MTRSESALGSQDPVSDSPSAVPPAVSLPPITVRFLQIEEAGAHAPDRWIPLEYVPVWKAMQEFTALRTPTPPDELWVLTHAPVFTQGQAGKPEHLLMPGDIPVVQIDRGGQVTYHGPGQLVVYLLVDVRRLHLGARALVEEIENSVIDVLAGYGIVGESQRKAPGVYVNGAKIAALGLRIRNGCSYHGVSFNIAMDLSPFSRINPCGYAGMPVTQLSDHVGSALSPDALMGEAAAALIHSLTKRLAAPHLRAL